MLSELRSAARAQIRARLSEDGQRQIRGWVRARRQALEKKAWLVGGRTVVWTSDGRCELVPFETPRAGRGEVTVEVAYSIVSPGTERAQYLRLPNATIQYPYRPGYSAAGRVIALGKDVEGISMGDAVAVRGLPHASVGTVPVERVFRIPTDVDLESAALIRLGIISALGVRAARLSAGEAITVIGGGLIGLLAQRIAAARGAGRATVIARTRAKSAAVEAGSGRFLTADEDREIAQLATPVVFEATGDPAAFALAVLAAAPGGRVVLLGSPRGVTSGVDVEAIREKRLEIVGAHVEAGSRNGPSDVELQRLEGEAFLEALAERRLCVDDLITPRVDPREAAAFYRELASGRSTLGASFDWNRLPSDERLARVEPWTRPDVSGRGIHFSSPMKAPKDRRASSILDLPDPLADAVGLLRVALLGCGDIAVRNSAAVASAPNTELVACYDPVRSLADDIARSHGCEVATSTEELLERNDVDAVFLSVPHHLHAPLAIEAMERGKHVMVEKPPANDLAAAIAMTRAAEDAGVALSICFPHRYLPSVTVAQRLLAAGALGEFGGGLARFFSDKHPSYWLSGFSGRSVTNWRGKRELAGGGVLIMNLSHYVDLVCFLAGVKAQTVTAVAASEEESEVEDWINVAVEFENGAAATFLGCTAARGMLGVPELQIWGLDGHIAIEPRPQVFTLRAVDGFRTTRWQETGPLPMAPIRTVFVSRFASAVTEGRNPEVTASDGLAAQALIEAAYRSVQSRTSVRVADVLAEAGA